MNQPEPNHLSEETLHAFLDGELPTTRHADCAAHVEICAECAARLAELEALFAALERLPEARLERSLKPAVMAAIEGGAHSARQWGWLLTFEAILALGLMALSAPFWLSRLPAWPLQPVQIFPFEIIERLHGAFALFIRGIRLSVDISLGIPVRSASWALILAAGAWIAGNALLLRPAPRRSD